MVGYRALQEPELEDESLPVSSSPSDFVGTVQRLGVVR